MEKQQFYNEYLRNNDYYRIAMRNSDQEHFSKSFDGMYDMAKVNLTFFSERDGSSVLDTRSGHPHFEAISLRTADRILKTYASGLKDDESISWMLVADWKSVDKSHGDSRFVTRLRITGDDRTNDHIIEQRMVDEFIRNYDLKLAGKQKHSFDLSRMMRLPEMYSRLMDESRQFIDSKYVSKDNSLQSDLSNVKEPEIWHSFDVTRSDNLKGRKTGR